MMKFFHTLACLLSAIGAINWGFVAFMKMDLVKEASKYMTGIPHIEEIIYGIIAVSGLLVLLGIFFRQ